VRAHDADRRVRVIPNQTPGVREQVRLSKADVERAAWAIMSDGAYFAGAAAANRVLVELPRWRVLARFYRVAPLRWIEDRFYEWIVAHRHMFERWSVAPECARPNVRCVPEGE